jgi:hypothetical protein
MIQTFSCSILKLAHRFPEEIVHKLDHLDFNASVNNFSAWGIGASLHKALYWACKAQKISATPVRHLDHGIGSNRYIYGTMAVWHQPIRTLIKSAKQYSDPKFAPLSV